MKVVQINSVCGVGSTGRIAVDISRELNNESVENYIFYGVGSSDYQFGIKIGNHLNVREHQIKTRLLGKHGFYSKSTTKELVRMVREINPDIVHLHNLHGHYLNIEVLFKALKELKSKVVWTLHDCWSYTGHCAYYDYHGCEKWKTGCEKCPARLEYPRSLVFDRSKESYLDKKKIFTSVDNITLVTPSQWLADEVKKSFLSRFPTTVIRNGIDVHVFKPCESNFRVKHNIKDKFIILGVASVWGKRKGYKYFLDLAQTISDNEVIVLVGLNDGQRKDLPANIIGINRTNSIQELAEIYSTADVFVNPTLEDNFPTTNLESLACGTPVITYNTGGSPEAVNKTTGFVVDKGDLAELARSIKKIKHEGKAKYSQHCRQRALDLFNKDSMYKKYIDLYKSTGIGH